MGIAPPPEIALDRPQWITAALVVVAAAIVGVWYAGRSPAPPPLAVDPGSGGGRTITVHVAGAVLSPGVVRVVAGARVGEAIAAAGGARGDADLGRVNLAAPLADGQQLSVPTVSAGGQGGAVTDDGRVRLNVAGVQELEALPGVGPVLAGRIFAYREEHGPFAVVEDLLDVPGIGEGKLASLREVVLVP
ncbi:MAG: ComEA family DNA-binding protein [Actinomycetota bacterium]